MSQAALEAVMQGRTTLVFADRLPTVEKADRVVLLGKGRSRRDRQPPGITGKRWGLRQAFANFADAQKWCALNQRKL